MMLYKISKISRDNIIFPMDDIVSLFFNKTNKSSFLKKKIILKSPWYWHPQSVPKSLSLFLLRECAAKIYQAPIGAQTLKAALWAD